MVPIFGPPSVDILAGFGEVREKGEERGQGEKEEKDGMGEENGKRKGGDASPPTSNGCTYDIGHISDFFTL